MAIAYFLKSVFICQICVICVPKLLLFLCSKVLSFNFINFTNFSSLLLYPFLSVLICGDSLFFKIRFYLSNLCNLCSKALAFPVFQSSFFQLYKLYKLYKLLFALALSVSIRIQSAAIAYFLKSVFICLIRVIRVPKFLLLLYLCSKLLARSRPPATCLSLPLLNLYTSNHLCQIPMLQLQNSLLQTLSRLALNHAQPLLQNHLASVIFLIHKMNRYT